MHYSGREDQTRDLVISEVDINFSNLTFRFLMLSFPNLTFPNLSGADPENFHGRWLTGWLPIVNNTGAKGVAG